MKRITAVVKTSEVSVVRKAIFAAGGNRMAVAVVPHRLCSVELADWYCGTPNADQADHVRLDVIVDDIRSENVISAIIATAHNGMIEKIAFLPAKRSHSSADLWAKRAA
jgi:nitrogen regulatory protein PII